MVGRGDRLVRRRLVAFEMDEADIVRTFRPDDRRTGLDGLGGRNDGGQRFIFDFDQLGGIDRLRLRLGDDEGDIIADPAHFVGD